MPSDKQQLASTLLKRPVLDYIGELRDNGYSWAAISIALYQDTKGKASVTAETLRTWDRKR